MNAEFQRIARRKKKSFLNKQSKEIEENNRMGNPRDLLKKIEAIKQPFHERMSTTKDRNGRDLTEAEEIKNQQEYTGEIYIYSLNDLDNHNDVATQLESDILEYEVKWALGKLTMNKASGDDRIPPETFKNHKK